MAYSFHLVLIHGITGEGLFHRTTNEACDFFSQKFPQAYIHEFEFPGAFDRSYRPRDIQKQGKFVLDTLLQKSRDDPHIENIPLILMGHDLGGSLIKQILLIATKETNYRPITMRVKGIIFLGTPHAGIDVAVWEQHIVRLLAVAKVETCRPSQFIQGLPAMLKDSGDDFAAGLWCFGIVNLFQRREEHNSYPLAIDEAFTSLDLLEDNNIGVSSAHDQLWEFTSGEPKSEMLCEKIEALVKTEQYHQSTQQKFLYALSQRDPRVHCFSTARVPAKSIQRLMNNTCYEEWTMNPNTGILHLYGSSGSETAILACHIIKDRIVRSRGYQNAVALSFYFDRRDIRAQSGMSLVVSLCRQLLLARPSLFRHILPLCEYLLDKGLFTTELLNSLLNSLIQHSAGSTIYCIIHAVDECKTSLDDCINSLSRLTQSAYGNLKIILTSDKPYSLGSHFCVPGTCCEIPSTDESSVPTAAKAQVRDYVARAAQENPLWAEFETEIIKTLGESSETYLYTMHRLAVLESSGIRSTPDAFSHRLVHPVPTQDQWVMLALLWVFNAVRPLRGSELAVTVALDQLENENQRVSITLPALMPRDVARDLVQTAGPLIRVVDDYIVPAHDNYVVPLNMSLEESWPVSESHFDPHFDPHFVILSDCLHYLYLHLGHYNEDTSPPNLANGLVDYASVYWPEHYKQTSLALKGRAASKILDFMSDRDSFRCWARIYKQREAVLHGGCVFLDTPLEIICFLGIVDLAADLILMVKDCIDCDSQLERALNQAVRYGHRDVVSVLLMYGAKSRDALSQAAAGGHIGVMEDLLRADQTTTYEDGSNYTPLHHAACCGHLQAVVTMIEWKAPLNARAEDGSSPLCLAARVGHIAIVNRLIQCGADITVESNIGFDALKFAAQGGYSTIVALLLAEGADVARPARDGNTALHLAAQFGHSDTLNVLLRQTHDVNCTNADNLTPLHVAAHEGFFRITRQLLDAQPEADPSSRCVEIDCGMRVLQPYVLEDCHRSTPMQLAAMKDHREIVQALLEDRRGHAAEDCSISLYLAASNGSGPIVEELLKHKSSSAVIDSSRNTLLHQAIGGGSASVLSRLLDSTLADINSANSSGLTPLHSAARIGNTVMVRMILHKGADVVSQTARSETPLQLAAREGHFPVVRELQSAMNDIEQRDVDGYTAFDLAVSEGHVEIVEYLLQVRNYLELPLHYSPILRNEVVLKALLDSGLWDCNAVNQESSQTALHLTVEMNMVHSTRLLLESNVDRDSRDSQGMTPLAIAARDGSSEIARVLLEANAGVDITDQSNRTPLFTACWEGRVNSVKELLKWNPGVELANNEGWTPLHAAYDHPEITKLLLNANADPHRVTANHQSTALSMAVYDDKLIETVRHHLEAGADPDKVDKDGETAVHRAVLGGSLDVLKLLALHSATLDAQRNDGSTPLHLAAIGAREDIALFLIDNNVDIGKVSESYGSVLMAAASGGLPSVARKLLGKGVEVNEIHTLYGTEIGEHASVAVCKPYHNAVQAAAFYSKATMVKFLINHGTDDDFLASRGSALVAAILGTKADTESIVRILLAAAAPVNYTSETGNSVLRMAVNQGLEGVVRLLIDKGRANTAHEPPHKGPLIHTIIQKGQKNMLTALLKDRRNMSIKDKFGRSLLSNAIVSKCESVVRLLLQRDDVDINEKDHAGCTPLMLAVIHHSNQLRRLLTMQPDINAQDLEGRTALMHACILDLKGPVARLLGAKADLSIVDIRGRGALYWACRRSAITVFDQILQALAGDVLISQCGHAISAAVASNRPSFLDRLLKYEGALPSERDADGWTPLYTADRYGLGSMKKRLLYAEVDEKDSSTRRPPKLPSRWSDQDKTASLAVDPKTQWVKVQSSPLTPGDQWAAMANGTVRANHAMYPIAALNDVYYYEVRIEKNRPPKSWAIGFCEEHTPLNLQVGLGARSWGYRGDHGLAFSEGIAHDFGETYDTGDTVGCGVNFKERTAFYTKNNNIIGRAFIDVTGKLYPAVSVDLSMEEAQASVTFWNGDRNGFVFQGNFDDPATLQPPQRYAEDSQEIQTPVQQWGNYQLDDAINDLLGEPARRHIDRIQRLQDTTTWYRDERRLHSRVQPHLQPWTLEIPSLDLADADFVASKSSQLLSSDIAYTHQIARTRRLQDWIKSRRSGNLLVYWDREPLRTVAGISPLSVFCATMANQLDDACIVNAVWFCGLHGHSAFNSDSDAYVGVRPMLASLINQLLRQFEFFDVIWLEQNIDLAAVQAGNLVERIKLLIYLVQRLPDTRPLVVFIDDVAAFERPEFKDEALQVFIALLRLTEDDAGVGTVVKILLTSTPGTGLLWGLVEEESVLEVGALPSLETTQTEERTTKALHEEAAHRMEDSDVSDNKPETGGFPTNETPTPTPLTPTRQNKTKSEQPTPIPLDSTRQEKAGHGSIAPMPLTPTRRSEDNAARLMDEEEQSNLPYLEEAEQEARERKIESPGYEGQMAEPGDTVPASAIVLPQQSSVETPAEIEHESVDSLPEKTLDNLNGSWMMDTMLSGNTDAFYALQGLSWMIRKTIQFATTTLFCFHYKDDTGTEHLNFDVVHTPGNMVWPGESYTLDWKWRNSADSIFGPVRSRSRRIKLADIADDEESRWMKEGWDETVTNKGECIETLVESHNAGWTVNQFWGFEVIGGERRYTRHAIVKNDRRSAMVRHVYNFAGPLPEIYKERGLVLRQQTGGEGSSQADEQEGKVGY